MARLSLLVGLLAGCNGPRYPHTWDGPEGGPTVAVSQGPDRVLPNPHLRATCTRTENALRYSCEVWIDPPQPVEVSFTKADGTGPVRTHRSDLASHDHTVGLYFMAHQTEYSWTVRGTLEPSVGTIGGAFTTGTPPIGARARFEVSEGTPSSPMIGFVSPCNDGANAIVVDPSTNDVLWYHDFALSPIGFMDAVTFTEDRTVMAIADGALREVDLMGEPRLELFPAIDLPNRVHHDVYRKDGRTYLLFQELLQVGEDDYLIDGFYVIDEGGELLGEWHLADHFFPTEPEPGPNHFAQDYSHANAIWVDDDRNVLVSFRHLSAVALVDGDPASPTFGAIAWRLANPTSIFGTDFALTSAVPGPANFVRQHNAHFLPDGSLLMLDNRLLYYEMSRVLKLSVDPLGFEATIEAAYELPNHCDFQGGAMLTPSGNVLATCAPSREAFEFAEDGELVWEGIGACTVGFGAFVPRFVPLDW